MDPNKRRKLDGANAFNVLQSLSRSGDSATTSATNSPTRTPRSQVKREQSDDTGPSRSVKYSSFQLSKSNCRVRDDGVTELRLKEKSRFVVLGSFKINVLKGEVVVAGATLRPSDHLCLVHAPLCQSMPVLRTEEDTRLELYQDPGSLGLRSLGHLSPMLRRIWNEPSESQASQSKSSTFKILGSSDDVPKRCVVQELVSPPLWNKHLASLLEAFSQGRTSKTLICGPKSAGKSTFSKILMNRLLTKRPSENGYQGVMLLDLDPGQPEYGLPGTLSLVQLMEPNIAPSFINSNLAGRRTHIVRCHALAATTPASNTELYQEAAFDLFEMFKKYFAHLPLIINTPGWILGTGLELLENIIRQTSPDEVVYMSQDGPSETVEALQQATGSSFTPLPSQPTEFAGRTGAHLRAMSTMCYFHSRMGGVNAERWIKEPLSSIRPWNVAFKGPNKGVLGVLSYDYQAPLHILAQAINGMVVALVEVESREAYQQLLKSGSNEPKLLYTPEGLPCFVNPEDATLDPRHSQTIGLALIRGITEDSFHMITPIPIERIEESKKKGRDLLLLYGKFDTPDWAYKENLYHESDANDDEEDPEGLGTDATQELVDAGGVDSAKGNQGAVERPWVEVLEGHEKRPLGSKVWRVRRDLGKNNNG